LIASHFKESLLHVILRNDSKPKSITVQIVIDAGIDVNALELDGSSPLWWSVVGGHEDAFELLLTHGADPHI
jgi:ankyrin repeat protein